MKDLESLVKRTLADIASSADLAALEAVRVSALGKKGALTELLKGLGRMAPEERRALVPTAPDRADWLPAAGVIFERILDAAGARDMVVSDRGLRFGVLAER